MSTSPDLVAIKGRQQIAWGAGDYDQIASRFILMSELLCEAVDLEAGQLVLDVAGGTGNTSLAAARRFGVVTCTDFVPELLERARQRADGEGLDMSFREADAENLPFDDGSFDVVFSAVGAMFAPNQEQVARELLRVCRPGGKIGMANWRPDGFVGEFFSIIGRYVPPPAGLQTPLRWGTEAGLRDLFGDGISSLSITQREHLYRFRSAEHFVDLFRTYYGPVTKAFESLAPDRQDELANEIAAAVRRFQISGRETAIWPGAYLEVVAVRA